VKTVCRMVFWVSSLLLTLCAAGQEFVAVPGAKVLRNVAYGASAVQIMDVYLPPQPKDAPVILMVHGGAWTIGDKSARGVVQNKAAHWLPKGYIFISIDNRLLPAAGPLEQAHDAAKALAFAQGKARSGGGDPGRFVLMGHSAGAHLVDVLASDPQLTAQEGVKPWLGTVSLDTASVDVVRAMQRRHAGFYDAAFGKDPAYWASVSPMQLLTAAPKPMLLVCSAIRPDRPCVETRDFAAKVTQFGGKATVLPENLTHAEVNANLGLPGEYTAAVDAFLQSLGLP
jgi:arylformamidase